MLTFGSHLDGYHDVADQMIGHIKRRASEHFRRREREKAELRTIPQFEAYRALMRSNFLLAIGGLPEERTPLDAQVTGILDRGAYQIEKLLYFSQPEFPVTASLYVPDARRTQPGAAVLFVCGHAQEAKAYREYQKVCIELAEDGFTVLCIDPPGQGERFQFIDEESGHQRIQWGTTEHTYAGVPYYMTGMSIARHFLWDAMRGIDYLCTRKEVDPQRIGVTGNSGGGLQTTFLMVAEPRIAAAMPCTFIMDYEGYLKTGQPQDGEQNLYAGFSDGPDHDDFITCMAPKPVRLGLCAYDFFPIESSLAAMERARKIYELFGSDAPKQVDYAVTNTTHLYSDGLRQSAVNFFRRALRGEAETFVTRKPEGLDPDTLNVTKTGQVLSALPGCKTVSALLRKEAQYRLPLSPRRIEAGALRKDLEHWLGLGDEQPEHEARVNGLSRSRQIYPRVIHDGNVNGYRVEKIFFFSEPDVCVAGVFIHPRSSEPATATDVLLLEGGTPEIPNTHAKILSKLEEGRNVFVFDVRGTGAVKTRPLTSYEGPHGTEFILATNCMKMKLSTLGLRTFDVLRAIDYLATRSDAGEIRLHGVGAAAAWGLYAAVFDQRVAELTLENAPLSYRAAVETRYYDARTYDFRVSAWGLLQVADLVDCFNALAPRHVTLVRPLGADGQPLTQEALESLLFEPASGAGVIGAAVYGWKPKVL